MLRTVYPQASVYLRTTKATHLEIPGREPIELCYLEDGIWGDTDYIENFIENSNHQELPSNRVVRVIAAPCHSIAGPSLLAVASKDFRLVFDDVDLWFIQTCATMISQMWNKRLLAEVMRAEEKFLRGGSHQLRTPIYGILGSADLLAEELISRKAILEAATSAVTSAVGGPLVYLDTIKTSWRELISIVNSMITLNRG
jgi:signal transduction histidine kinase